MGPVLSETVLKVLLKELQTIQIVCLLNGCGTVLEMPLEKLLRKAEESAGEIRCPMCQAVFQAPHYSALGDLARSILKLAERHKDLGVRFVISQAPDDKPA